MIKRFLTGHRPLAIAIPAIAVIAILGASVMLVSGLGGQSHATATPGATDTPIPSPSDSPTPLESPTPTIDLGPTPLPLGMAYADLDGVATTTALAHREPLAIMVDDNKVARPQSGISSASIVYQAPADGGEDRYMMIFQEGTASAIGPVRSARPYYVYWAAEYRAVFGHYGGDRKSRMVTIPAMAGYIHNMDALNGGGCPYHRVTTRPAPHNAYTSTAALIGCDAAKKYPATFNQKLPTRPFRGDTDPALLPAAQTIGIVYRTGTIGYQFDRTKDAYLRLVGGAPEIDPANNQQVYARSIVVMDQFNTNDLSEPGHIRPDVHNVGSGAVTIFQEGTMIKGTWKKTSNTALTRFYDSNGKEISLVRGEIFIQSKPPENRMSVS